MMLELRMHA